jgi:hypothetical protein
MPDIKLIKPGEFTETNTSTNATAYSLSKEEKEGHNDKHLTGTDGRQKRMKPRKAHLEASIPQITPRSTSRRSPAKHHLVEPYISRSWLIIQQIPAWSLVLEFILHSCKKVIVLKIIAEG